MTSMHVMRVADTQSIEKNVKTMAKMPVNEQVTELIVHMIGDTTTAVSLNNLAGMSNLVKSDLTDSTE